MYNKSIIFNFILLIVLFYFLILDNFNIVETNFHNNPFLIFSSFCFLLVPIHNTILQIRIKSKTKFLNNFRLFAITYNSLFILLPFLFTISFPNVLDSIETGVIFDTIGLFWFLFMPLSNILLFYKMNKFLKKESYIAI